MAEQHQSVDKNKQNKQPKIKLPDVEPLPQQASITDVFDGGTVQTQAEKLADVPWQSVQRQALARQIGRGQGNHHLQRVLNIAQQGGVRQSVQPSTNRTLQRRDPDDAKADPELPTFTVGQYIYGGPRFDAEYTPVGPVPQIGTFEIILKVHITYKHFTRRMMRKEPYRSYRFTRDQRKDFKWTDEEKIKFATDFKKSVTEGWGEKYKFHLKDPSFAEYQTGSVKVRSEVVDDPAQAHTKITAQKVPKDAPRFRSFVAGDEATLDIRDPSEEETHKVPERELVRQIKPFGFDSADVTPVKPQVDEVDQKLKEIGAAQPPGTKDWVVGFRGRASSKGNKGYNKKLGQQRAEAVKNQITADLSWAHVVLTSEGEENASEDEKFQRVDVAVTKNVDDTEVSQNVAAHEAGHMFGLGDEYVEEDPDTGAIPKFFGDEPTHYGDVQAHIGTDEANELLNQGSGSIMSEGGTVHKGHYVYFLEALKSMTKKDWTIE